MKALIKKELTLNWRWYNYMFFVMPLMIFIPGYPSCVGLLYTFFFVTSLYSGFDGVGEYRFLAELPVRKKEIVRVRMFDSVFGQMGSLLIALPLCALERWVLAPEGKVLLDAGLALIGTTLIEYGVFLLVFYPLYFKNLKSPKPFLLAITAQILTIGVIEILIAAVPYLNTHIDGYGHLGWRIGVLLIGLFFYVGAVVLTEKRSLKNFERYDF